jgi:hypothetical protein
VLGRPRNSKNNSVGSDQAKLAEYLNSVRETELRVQRQVDWVDVPKPQSIPKASAQQQAR